MEIADPVSCIIVAIAGLLFIFIGIVLVRRGIRRKKTCTASTPGTVDSYEETVRYRNEDGHSHREVNHFPFFRFTVDGTEYVIKSMTGGNPAKKPVGTGVTVLYEPGNPENFYVKGHDNDTFAGKLSIAIGAFASLAGIALAIYGYMQ
jgi:hypothetical protein